MNRTPVIERAFELARSGRFANVAFCSDAMLWLAVPPTNTANGARLKMSTITGACRSW